MFVRMYQSGQQTVHLFSLLALHLNETKSAINYTTLTLVKLKSYFCLIAFCVLVSCQGIHHPKSNPYLGEIPILLSRYRQLCEQKETEALQSGDLARLARLEDELSSFEEQSNQKIVEMIKDTAHIRRIPVVNLPERPYLIRSAIISDGSTRKLKLKFKVDLLQDSADKLKNPFLIYYKAVDAQGMEIPDSKSMAVNTYRDSLQVGKAYELFGHWEASTVMRMYDLYAIIEISEREFRR